MIKKLIVILSLVASLTSCKMINMEIAQISNTHYEELLGNGFTFYEPDWIDEIESFEQIPYVMEQHITYKRESTDYWQSPEETCILGTGDCEDFSILFMNIAFLKFGYVCNLVLINTEDSTCRAVVSGDWDINHAIVEYNYDYIEATKSKEEGFYYWIKLTVDFRFCFAEVLHY